MLLLYKFLPTGFTNKDSKLVASVKGSMDAM